MGYIHPSVYALLVGPPLAGPVDCFLSFYEVDGGVLLVWTPDNNSCALAKLYDNVATAIQETRNLGMVNDAIATQLSELKPGWKENGTIFQAKTIKALCGFVVPTVGRITSVAFSNDIHCGELNMAENSKQNSKKGEHLARYRFRPGQSGNPGGRPKVKPITELYERILEDPENLAAIKAAVLKSLTRAGSVAMVLMLREMTDRVEGKVVQAIEADVTVTNLADVIAAARKRAGKV